MKWVDGFKHLWNITSNLGITDSLGQDERRRVKLLNQFALVLILAGLPSLVYSLVIQMYYDVIVLLTTFSIFFVILHLQHHKQYHAARLFLNIVIPLSIICIIMVFGQQSGAEVFYAPLFVTLAVFYDSWKTRIGLLAWLIGSFTISQVYVAFFDSPLDFNVTQFAQVYALVVANISCLVLFATYIAENKAYQIQTEKLLDLLKINNDKLNSANEDLEGFAYVASHELKAPVRTISNFLALMEKEVESGAENQKLLEYIEYVKGSSQEMTMLINDLLEYSKLEEEQLKIEPIDLNDILLITQNNLRATLEQKKAQITANKLPVINANKTHMIILFQNLIENAVKYNQSPQPQIEIYTDEAGDLYVKDNGIGIDEVYHQKIFRMFIRLHGQDEYTGTGIGLSACKKIMNRHNGTISLVSKPKEGTTFRLSFAKQINSSTRQNAH